MQGRKKEESVLKMNRIKVYQPQYFKKFKCAGSGCRSNCCNSWRVFIDKDTYDKYMNLDGEAGKEFIEKIKVTEHEPFVAQILMDENKKCPFLNDRGLCGIQAKYGHDYLGYVCRVFPRKVSRIADELEVFLDLGCEGAARLILFEKNIMMLEDAMSDIISIGIASTTVTSTAVGGEPVNVHYTLDAKKYTFVENAVVVFWKLRTASIVIMQSRQYRIQVRMLILAIFIEQVDGLLTSGRDAEVARLADEFLNRMDTGFYDSLNEQAPAAGADSNPEVILDILKDMDKRAIGAYSKYLRQAMEGFRIPPDSLEIPRSYNEEYTRYYNLYLADNEYILENYLVNIIFSEGFPFNYKNESSVMKNFAELLARYDMIRFLIIGVSRYYMKFDKRRVVECVASFTRNYDHSSKGYLMMG
jgi:lysine-N-methylase